MEKVNEGKNAEEDEVRRQTHGRMDFKSPRQVQFPELRMESQYAQETAQFARTHD